MFKPLYYEKGAQWNQSGHSTGIDNRKETKEYKHLKFDFEDMEELASAVYLAIQFIEKNY